MKKNFSVCAFVVLLLSTLLPLVQASAPALFCKCATKYNSSIIALNPVTSTPEEGKSRKVHTCNECNRQLCKDYDFKWIHEAGFKDEELITTCFQRDSVKDQAVVYTFMMVTVGLLVYAGVRPWVEKRVDSSQDRARYAPVSSGQNLG